MCNIPLQNLFQEFSNGTKMIFYKKVIQQDINNKKWLFKRALIKKIILIQQTSILEVKHLEKKTME